MSGTSAPIGRDLVAARGLVLIVRQAPLCAPAPDEERCAHVTLAHRFGCRVLAALV